MNNSAILFDLDGTLLPMDTEAFTKTYFGALCKKLAPYGYQPEELIKAIWAGVKAVVAGDGSMTGEERFWMTFASIYGEGVYEHRPIIDEFYENEFNDAKSATQPTVIAAELVAAARKKTNHVILATNPIFPYNGVQTRLNWAGLKEQDFEWITSYETSSYCKPNPMYFQELLERLNLSPENCVLIGNDVNEDIKAAQSLGIRTYLVTDCLLGNPDEVTTEQGSLQDAICWVENL